MYKSRLIFPYLFFLLYLSSTSLLSQQQNLTVPKITGSLNNIIQLNAPDVLRTASNTLEAEEKMNREILRYRQTDSTIFLVPVVFHIVNTDPLSITDQQIKDALKELNDAFAKAGSYSSGSGVNTKIQFCLARKDPDGGITTGITRTQSFFSEYLNPVIEDERLKNLVQWDPNKYINIWHIKSMELEIFPQFNCGKWFRAKAAGYATMPPNVGKLDGIVITAFNKILIHEMGHYLGLYHTFEGFDCRNGDCNTDGDKVCDTPPDASVFSISNCNDPYNSCSSDTLSGYTVDMPDNTSNFMDYGNEACQNMFTEGQATRMRAAIATQRPSLLESNCLPPCSEMIVARFTRNKPNPLPGDVVNFLNISTGASRYEWLVNGSIISTAFNFSYTFNATGKNKVTLKAYGGSDCFATSSDFVITTCGVTARFYSDKAFLTTKSVAYTDTLRLFNTSVNATSFQWLMSNDRGMNEQVISTDVNFTYIFSTPGNYKIKLNATNGNCTDETLSFPITVIDPTPDAGIKIYSAECVEGTKIKLVLSVCNYGYAAVPKNFPISFYDADPRLATSNKVGVTIFTPDTIFGNCCGALINYTLDVGRTGLNKLYAVVGDSGNARPITFPLKHLIEKDYNNNIAIIQNFGFKVQALPQTSILEPGDTIQLNATAGPGVVTSYTWSTVANLSCTTCQSPFLIADTSTIKKVIASSNRGCSDTAYVDIKVPPYNDYRVAINDAQCAGKDSLHIDFTLYNDFKRGVLPSTLSVSFYNGNPATSGAILLSPVFLLPDTITAKQFSFITRVKAMNAGTLYAVVNDNGSTLPANLPNTLLTEKNYLNNVAVKVYAPEKVFIQPSDTTVLRKEFVALKINTTIFNPASTLWSTGSDYTLSCTNCPVTMVQVFDSTIIKVQTENKYGCALEGTAIVNIFPPDMQVKILDTKCYSDNTALVTFSICMNNNYDSVYANIPVSFYDGNPANGSARLLQPTFITPKLQAGECYTYAAKVAAPSTNNIYAVVNDKGSNRSSIPAKFYEETNYTNNGSQAAYTPFRVSINPSDTFIQRLTSISLTPQAEGGILSAFLWKPSPFISCTNCATPVVTPQYTSRYELLARNENFCTDTAIATVRTHTGADVFIPGAFTPNNDKLNDVFYVLTGADAVIIKDFTIFNRLGQKIFQVQNVAANNPNFGWNGKAFGHDAEAGTYVYIATIIYADGTEQLYKGTVVLIR